MKVGVFIACFTSYSCGWRASWFRTRRGRIDEILDRYEEGEDDEAEEWDVDVDENED